MAATNVDSLERRLGHRGTRRTAVGSILAGLFLPLAAGARAKDKQRKRKVRKRKRADALAAGCWRAGSCIPRKGANVSQCDLAGSTSFNGLDCTGCNVSRANLRGVMARGANFTKANLSGACLLDADFTNAIFTQNTNLANALFCRTVMPDGSVNNSGCASGTACCPTCRQVGESCGPGNGGSCCGTSQCNNGVCQPCMPTTCERLGKRCGPWADGCGGTLHCGTCGTGETPSCHDGTCATCAATCAADCTSCCSRPAGETICQTGGVANCGLPLYQRRLVSAGVPGLSEHFHTAVRRPDLIPAGCMRHGSTRRLQLTRSMWPGAAWGRARVHHHFQVKHVVIPRSCGDDPRTRASG